ncbi:pseudaminic acid cytidylyltransferase [Aquincola sp. S2]|uniref:Pseudaminic acid cytidylyltransferase n=1 Tax=Pseudaquabacterium terrae TaxID=2732868 RepID=A0ABX2ENY6_9BURK|nr:pseudaminic acid cytidylyltransferase [Aquabacterium terrae]NRF70256.1 pseudaminic acid cytidylyltransferase [Aquabacterium terrae]
MRLAVIPARGGSKRIPRKNIRAFAGRPMIGYAIGAARETGVFDRIVVSTDDAEIAAIAREQGAEVPFMRPPELSNDTAGTMPVIQHAIDALAADGWPASQVCCIYPAVPLLQAQALRDALALLEEGGCDYVFPVLEFPSAVQRALVRDAAGATRAMYPEYADVRSQDLTPAYHDAGQFYWGRTDAWRAGTSPHLGAKTIVLPHWAAVDIDTPDDWARAEALFEALGKR